MCKVSAAITKLSKSECQSLARIGTGPTRGPVPFKHSLKLMSVGLAELNGGRMTLTPAGNRAVSMLPEGIRAHAPGRR